MKESDIAMIIACHGDHVRRYEIMLPNVYIQHDSEADLFCIRKSGLCDEFEIKTSRSDFLADKKKVVQFREMEYGEWKTFMWNKERNNAPNMKPKHQALVDGDMCVNYFWYVVLEGVADVEDVPFFAGLITVSKSGLMKIDKSPNRLHTKKMPIEERYKIARKSTYRYWDLRKKIIGENK